ncbi:unnamed protein product [marine sediment metagenome]|uniref:Uncharacterized protein n=1 Tax=marine sediment metagenome TaxID=412755 RepID=X0T1Z5_9ZZZZ
METNESGHSKERFRIDICNCCRKRKSDIVIGDGRCLECINPKERIFRWTMDQRDFMVANLNVIIGMILIVTLQRQTGYQVNPHTDAVILYWVYFSAITIAGMFIYNHLKK